MPGPFFVFLLIWSRNMPIYEYKCESCGKIFTKIQKFVDEPLTSHEECGSGPVERIISAPALHFKGTGWNVTDYAKSGAIKPPGKSEGDSKSEGSGKSDGVGKTESKSTETKSSSDSAPAAKSETKSDSKPAPSGS